jgi:uncharacterized protein (DUF433 family)
VDPSGAYAADRAAALSGVPYSTVQRWSRDLVVPSVSSERIKLWSYADLMGLRMVYWLRHPKVVSGREIRATSAKTIRKALEDLRNYDLAPWSVGRPSPLFIDYRGKVIVNVGDAYQDEHNQIVEPGVLNLIGVFHAQEGTKGPNLIAPRTLLRIVPGKLSGSPHVQGTRIETRVLSAFERDGYDMPHIARLYPTLARDQIEQAIDLEHQLDENLKAA